MAHSSEKQIVNKKQFKSTIDRIKQTEKQVLLGGRNLDYIIDLLQFLEAEDDKILFSAVTSLLKVFRHLLESGILVPYRSNDTNDKLHLWLFDRYKDACIKLGELLQQSSKLIQECSLNAIIKLINAEAEMTRKPNACKCQGHGILAHFIEPLVKGLLSTIIDQTTLFIRLEELFSYNDFQYWFMKSAIRLLKSYSTDDDFFKRNVFACLTSLVMNHDVKDDHLDHLLMSYEEGIKGKWSSYREHQKLFSTLWMTFLSFKLPNDLYEGVLANIHDKAIPHVTNPRLLCDFLTSSFDKGGITSVLALNGLFVLMTKFNLEYPEFFEKVYSLLEPSLLHVKYRTRFFTLLDLFLTSSHLPAYLVAAFIKRLSRLSLSAPVDFLQPMISFIYNLIRRHPSCTVLLNRPDCKDLTCDPFIDDESSLLKCHAIDSSLWEIETLENHFHHSIATLAQKRRFALTSEEDDLSVMLDGSSAENLFHMEAKRSCKETALTFLPPQGLFGNKDDKLRAHWCLN